MCAYVYEIVRKKTRREWWKRRSRRLPPSLLEVKCLRMIDINTKENSSRSVFLRRHKEISHAYSHEKKKNKEKKYKRSRSVRKLRGETAILQWAIVRPSQTNSAHSFLSLRIILIENSFALFNEYDRFSRITWPRFSTFSPLATYCHQFKIPLSREEFSKASLHVPPRPLIPFHKIRKGISMWKRLEGKPLKNR